MEKYKVNYNCLWWLLGFCALIFVVCITYNNIWVSILFSEHGMKFKNILQEVWLKHFLTYFVNWLIVILAFLKIKISGVLNLLVLYINVKFFYDVFFVSTSGFLGSWVWASYIGAASGCLMSISGIVLLMLWLLKRI